MPVYHTWRELTKLFETIAVASTVGSSSVRFGDFPEPIQAQAISAGLFPLLGVEPLLGRPFLQDDERPGAEPVTLLSHRLWQRRFEGDEAALGQQIWIDGRSYTIVGVMPRRFWFSSPGTGLWTPLQPSESDQSVSDRSLQAVARLRPNISDEGLHTRLAFSLRQMEDQLPESEQGWGVRIVPLVGVHLFGLQAAPGLFLLIGAVCLALLVACINVANIMVARWTARQKETAIRATLGAGRLRLIRQFLTESLLLALVGGLLGLAVTSAGVEVMLSFAPLEAQFFDFRIDGRILGLTAAITLLTAVFAGLLPAVFDTRPNLHEELKQGTVHSVTQSPRQRLRRVLVVSEVAVTIILIVVIGAMVRSYQQLDATETDFNSENLLTFRLPLNQDQFTDQAPGNGVDGISTLLNPRVFAFQQELLDRIERLPGVSSVAITLLPPPYDALRRRSFFTVNPAGVEAAERLEAGFNAISPAFFETLGIPLRRGRYFTIHDDRQAPKVALVNEAMARRQWPNRDPVGEYLWGDADLGNEPLRIVGVIRDYTNSGVLRDPEPAVYIPHFQQPLRYAGGQPAVPLEVNFVVRTLSDPTQLANALRREVAEIDPEQAISQVGTVDRLMDQAAEEVILGVYAISPLVGFALLLTAVGVYGVLSFSIARRTHEIGIRMALGADRRKVIEMVSVQSLRLVGFRTSNRSHRVFCPRAGGWQQDRRDAQR